MSEVHAHTYVEDSRDLPVKKLIQLFGWTYQL